MAEIKNKKVVIASVLKPVDDTRMTEKVAASIRKHTDLHVTVIGFPSTSDKTHLDAIALPQFGRLSARRLTIPWLILRQVLRIKPAVFIITTHELVLVAIVAKLMLGCRIVYDVQENYYLNIRFTNAFPPMIRPVVAGWVRLKEHICSKFVDRFWLAESGYSQELNFIRDRFVVLQNKVRKPETIPTNRGSKRLIFTGTLATTTGVFEAIKLAQQLHDIDKDIRLTIIGFCAKSSELSRIKASIERSDFIRLVGGDRLVPHPEILNAIENANAGIVAYPPNPSTTSAIPTKIYEYLAYGLPIVLIGNAKWAPFIKQSGGQVLVASDLEKDLSSMIQFAELKLDKSKISQDVYWESQEPNLILEITTLLNSLK